MPVSAADMKAALRCEKKAILNSLSPAKLEAGSRSLLEQFLALPELRDAGILFVYGSMGREVPTWELIRTLLQQGKRVALPRCLPHHEMEARLWDGSAPLIQHPYGMLEPGEDFPLCPPEQLDLILVPGLSFDKEGYRLGYGGGYYDRYLSRCRGLTVGLCRRALLEARLPRDAFDLPVQRLLVEALPK